MAARYWVGGTASWDGTAGTKWALTSGGAGGQAVPTAADDVFFDAASGAVTVTLGAAGVCNNIDFNGFTGTFTGSNTLAVSGNFRFSTGMTRSYTGIITFNATSTGKTITMNGKTLGNSVVFNGVGGGWTLQDTFTVSSANITLTAGSLNTNGVSVSCLNFSISGSTTRTLTLGASSITPSSWNAATTTNLTFNANTSTINTNGTFEGGGLTYNNLVSTGAGSIQINGSNTFANLTRTGTAALADNIIFSASQVITGTLTINGNSTTNRLWVRSLTRATAITLTAANVSASYVDLMDIVGAGAASWNLSAITGLSGDCGGNSGITFTTPATQTANGTTSFSWNNAARWTSRIPLPQDDVVINNAFGVSQVITGNMARLGKSIDISGATFTTNLTLTIGQASESYGSLILKSAMTVTANAFVHTFASRTNIDLNTNGVTFDKGIILDNPASTITLQANLTMGATRNLNVTRGTLTANNFIISTGNITVNSGTTFNLGTATHVLTLSSTGTVFSNSGTINASTGTIRITGLNGNLSFSGGGATYNIVHFDRGASTTNITISGNNTFSEFKDTGTAAHSLLFSTGTTQNIGTWTVSGTAGNLITINSTTTGAHNLVKSGGGQVSADYLNIQHSVATPGSTWYAGNNSVNNQAVATAGSGWIFTPPSAPSSVQFITANKHPWRA